MAYEIIRIYKWVIFDSLDKSIFWVSQGSTFFCFVIFLDVKRCSAEYHRWVHEIYPGTTVSKEGSRKMPQDIANACSGLPKVCRLVPIPLGKWTNFEPKNPPLLENQENHLKHPWLHDFGFQKPWIFQGVIIIVINVIMIIIIIINNNN